MSTNEDTVLSQYVPGFRANLALAPQQTQTLLADATDCEFAYDTPGQMFNADDVGVTDPQPQTGRVPDTPDSFISNVRRVGAFTPFVDAKWLDRVDQARELEDPTSKIMMALMAGRWRAVDNTIIAAANGPAMVMTTPGNYSSVAFPSAQIITANDVTFAHDAESVPTDNSPYGLSVGKLIHANYILDESELQGERYLALSSEQKADLVRRTPVTSKYYTDVVALRDGKLTEFLGFTIKRFQKVRLNTGTIVFNSTNYPVRQCLAWIKGALVYRGRPIEDAQIWRRHDKSGTPQAFYKMEHGAVRRYDTAVVEIDCYEGNPL